MGLPKLVHSLQGGVLCVEGEQGGRGYREIVLCAQFQAFQGTRQTVALLTQQLLNFHGISPEKER